MDEGVSPENTAFTIELLERVRPYLAESLIVLNRDWTIRANLAPPGGLIGRGLGVGLNTLENMHPDDIVTVLELGTQAFDTGPGWSGTKIVRLHTGEGVYRPYELTAFNLFDDPVVGGLLVRTREIVTDPHDDLVGLDTSTTLKSVAELLPVGLLLLDSNARPVYANEALCALTGLTAEQIKRSQGAPLVTPGGRSQVDEILERLIRKPGREDCVLTPAGQSARVIRCCFRSEGVERVTHIIATFEDVTESHAAHELLEHRATHDELTGLANRWSMLDIIRQRLADDAPTNVAYIDLDGFKEINDTWGHDRGDEILIALARSLEAGLTDLDGFAQVARIGGDEFVVVWDDSEPSDVIVDLIQRVIDGVTRAEGLEIAASIGTAAAGAGDTQRGLLARADQSMYHHKSARATPRRTMSDTNSDTD